ncbi:MAG: hypothetical protein DWI10_00510 [Planctomycetota bacterium]|nr:MAG: hypothetical protein DWI10_00510 [Planctomycetota bacterium]
MIVCASCSSSTRPDTQRISLSDFAHPPAELLTDVVEMSDEILEGPTLTTEGIAIEVDGRATTAQQSEVTSKRADGTTEVDYVSPLEVARALEPGQSWPVECLVGQVNGRPVFADAFFEPIEDQIIVATAMRDRTEARRALIETVRRQFKQTVDSELIVAEAESKLSAEQQQGLFAWIKTMQEETIAERGGSRAAAEASLEAEDAQTLDEFVQQTRDVMLARRLINERIAPRTIVAWRDVEQEYARRKAEFNPQPMIIIGRIRLNVTTDAAMVTQVKESIAAGKTFSAIALELKLPDGGRWNRFDLPPEGIKGTQLGDALKERLDGLAIDAMSEPLLQPDFITWLTVMTIDQPVARSIFDREVQLQLQAELKSRRTIIERERYISTLRSRWVTDDIGEMERRLLEIAVERYWR